VPSAADELRRAIAGAGGALRFDRYLDVALYGEHGFYSVTGRAGRRGDFLTSPEVGPLFGTVIARALDEWWVELGCPAPFRVVEIGAGPGTLARSVLASGARCIDTLRWIAVERSPAQRGLHPSAIESRIDLPTDPVHVVIGNEVLDNVPFRLLVNDGGWKESHVAVAGERFVEVLRPFTGTRHLPTDAPHGARIPLQDEAVELIRACRRLVSVGHMLFFDYCTPTTDNLARMPWREWLRTYRQHDRGGHYLDAPGEQDITCQVVLDQVIGGVDGAGVTTQAAFLGRWGVDALVDEGRRAWEAAASRPSVAALRMRSRVRESEALLDPHGLGGFTVMHWSFPTRA
jgi:SAM-dependent MidA family methyltransferase